MSSRTSDTIKHVASAKENWPYNQPKCLQKQSILESSRVRVPIKHFRCRSHSTHPRITQIAGYLFNQFVQDAPDGPQHLCRPIASKSGLPSCHDPAKFHHARLGMLQMVARRLIAGWDRLWEFACRILHKRVL